MEMAKKQIKDEFIEQALSLEGLDKSMDERFLVLEILRRLDAEK